MSTNVPDRLTIAYFAAEIVTNSTATGFWVGIEAEARRSDLNLVAFPGGVLSAMPVPEDKQEQANIIYELANTPTFDGLVIWASSIMRPIASDIERSDRALQAFHSRYGLPTVTLSKALPGCTVVTMENYQGMHEAIVHLIEEHGYRRIACIRGPVGHPFADQRFQAYLDTLAEYDIPVNPNIITNTGDWGSARGEEAIATFLDQRHLQPGSDIEAIVTASDVFALTAMANLQSRGIRVPEDIAIVGYNGSISARCATPPITSVQASLTKLGAETVRMLNALLKGEPIPEKRAVPTQLMVLQSCGCLNKRVDRAGRTLLETEDATVKAVFQSHREHILREMQAAATPIEISVQDWGETLLDAFVRELDSTHPGDFLLALREIIRQTAESPDSLVWHDVVSVIQYYVTRSQDSSASSLLLLNQARAMLSEMALRSQAEQRQRYDSETHRLHNIGSAFITTFDLHELSDRLATELIELNIPGCYLALYENPQPYHYPQPAPEWSRLIMAYNKDGRFPLDDTGQRFRTRELLPPGFMPTHRRFTMIAHPLYFQASQIGFVLFEVGTRQWLTYEILRNVLSSAMEGALLVQRVREGTAELTRQQYILDTFMENVPDRIYFKDCKGRITRANMAHARRMGLDDPAKEIGKSDFDFFPEDQAKRKAAHEQQIIQSGAPLLAIEETDAQGLWSLTTKMALRDEKGDIIGTFGISRDITELKQAQQALEQAYAEIVNLNEEITDENLQMRAEMDLSRRIQTALVPQRVRSIHPDFEIAATMLPAAEVGGDYYDIAFDREGNLWFGIGDVAGHGVTPGLIMMMAQTAHTAITTHYAVSPAAVVVIVNDVLLTNVQGRLEADYFMTFTTLKYLGNGHFSYAGSHLDLVIYRHRRQVCELIETEGLFLNLVDDIVQHTHNKHFSLDIGDILILYTDGITEAWNEHQEEFGLERLTAFVQESAHEDVAIMRDRLIQKALDWCHNNQDDDMTLVFIKRIQ